MKKILSLLLILAMLFTMTACAAKQEDVPADVPGNTEPADPEVPEDSDEPADEPEAENKPSAGGDTVAQTLLAAFKDYVAANPDAGAQAIADEMLANSVIQFSGATMPVEQGYLTGFGEAEIKGFSEGVMFAPMIGAIAFVGYVFVLEDGTDADAFVGTLSDNADPRWNICTEADETVVEAVDNIVFFVMSPNSLEG